MKWTGWSAIMTNQTGDFLCGGSPILTHGCHFIIYYTNLSLTHYSAKVGDRGLSKVHGEVSITQSVKQLLHLDLMFLPGIAVHDNVVQVACTTFQSLHHHIHKALECCRSDPESETHHRVQTQTRRRNKCPQSFYISVNGTWQFPFKKPNLLMNGAWPTWSTRGKTVPPRGSNKQCKSQSSWNNNAKMIWLSSVIKTIHIFISSFYCC